MRALARVLRRLADHIDPHWRPTYNVHVNGAVNQAALGREIERALLAHQRRTGRGMA